MIYNIRPNATRAHNNFAVLSHFRFNLQRITGHSGDELKFSGLFMLISLSPFANCLANIAGGFKQQPQLFIAQFDVTTRKDSRRLKKRYYRGQISGIFKIEWDRAQLHDRRVPLLLLITAGLHCASGIRHGLIRNYGIAVSTYFDLYV